MKCELVETLDALEKKATPGPWFADHDGDGSDVMRHVQRQGRTLRDTVAEIMSERTESDAELIAALRNAYPQIRKDLEEIGALRTALEEARRENERLRKELRGMEREAREAARDAAAEERWKGRQGEDYGSY